MFLDSKFLMPMNSHSSPKQIGNSVFMMMIKKNKSHSETIYSSNLRIDSMVSFFMSAWHLLKGYYLDAVLWLDCLRRYTHRQNFLYLIFSQQAEV